MHIHQLSLDPLPGDLSRANGSELKTARDERRDLLAAAFDQAGDDYDMSRVTVLSGDSTNKTRQLTSLNSDIERLDEVLNRPNPHPGHPARGRLGSRSALALPERAGWRAG